MRTNVLRLPALVLVLALTSVVGCSDDGEDASGLDGESSSDISASESLTMATEIALGTFTAINSGTVSSIAVAAGTNIPINVQYTGLINCPLGGRISLSGSASGSIDDNGSGSIFIQVLESIVDCAYGFDNGTRTVTINGAPSLSATGTFTFLNGQPGTQQTVRIGGGFNYDAQPGRTGFCAVSLTILMNLTAGTASISGTVCGNSMNFNV